MDTLLRDSVVTLPGVQRLGHRQWFTVQAEARGFSVSNKKSSHKAIKARVDHGRWIADCPLQRENQACNGAECVTTDDKVFLCLACGNAELGGDLIKVKFPTEKQRKAFEKNLCVRPEANRNWVPGETVKKIAEENRMHNLPVSEGDD